MSIVRLIVKQEIVLNLIYLFPECKEKCNFSNNSSNVLYYGNLHRVNQYGHDLSKMVPLPGMLSHLTPYYRRSRLHRLIHSLKNGSKSKIKK